MDESKQIFTQVLNSLSEKEMKSFINKYCKTNKAMVNKFISMFAHKIEGNCQKKFNIIVDNSIEALLNRRSRFIINPSKANNALRPIFKLLKEEQNSYHEKPYESFVLIKILFFYFSDLIEDFYEVHKFDLIDELFIEIINLLSSIYHSKTTPYEFKEELFTYILDKAREDYCDKISYYGRYLVDLNLVRILSEDMETEKKDKIIELIDYKISYKSDDKKERFIKLKSEILEVSSK